MVCLRDCLFPSVPAPSLVPNIRRPPSPRVVFFALKGKNQTVEKPYFF